MTDAITNINLITKQQIEKVMPPKLKGSITDSIVDALNNLQETTYVADSIRNNFISYTGVLNEGRFKVEDYLNAVKYVSFKLLGNTNQDAYIKTFPQRYAQLIAQGATPKEISCYVTAFNKGKLVNLIMEQTLVPTWVLNADIHQKAINTLAEIMMTGKSERTKVMAADSLLNHLAKPKEAGPLINIDMRENSGLNELKNSLADLANMQKQAIMKKTLTPKDVTEQRIMQNVEDLN